MLLGWEEVGSLSAKLLLAGSRITATQASKNKTYVNCNADPPPFCLRTHVDAGINLKVSLALEYLK